jgi:hypothetical protein
MRLDQRLEREHHIISYGALKRQYKETVQFLLHVILKLTTRMCVQEM